jgi:hypothetical protein
MNDHTRQGRRRGLPRRAAILTAAVGLALLPAACGSSSTGRSPQAYSECMRKHGVTGTLAAPPPTALPTAPPTRPGVLIPDKVGAAMQACQSLAPRPTGLRAS